jgi:hypothetical protein
MAVHEFLSELVDTTILSKLFISPSGCFCYHEGMNRTWHANTINRRFSW